jgi:homoserine kinase
MPDPTPDAELEVVVPASTSNLGPGFDFLGLALDLPLRVRVLATATEGPHRIERRSGTAESWPDDPSNLFFRAFDLGCERLHARRRALQIAVDSQIPIARGLGSSGAAIAAGLLLASHLAPRPAEILELCEYGLALEGHPDNVCAALLGGCTLSVPLGGGKLRILEQPLAPSLAFALAWPERALATSEARRVLPKSVPFADAVENPRRLALLLEGLRSGDPELLRHGAEDRLHVAHRLPLIQGAREALEAARANGASLATISGSGSALIAIGSARGVESIARAMAKELEHAGAVAHARVARPVVGVARVHAG